jgi:hypothetical protein
MSEPQKKYRIGIPLLGKGGTNHLHRKELAEAFQDNGVEICFLVREDYFSLLNRIPGCQYILYQPPDIANKIIQRLLGFCLAIRRLYPRWNPYQKWQYQALVSQNPSLLGRAWHRFQYRLSGYPWIMRFLGRIEGFVYRSLKCGDLEALGIDQLLILGVGSPIDNLSGPLTWWAIRKKIPVINFVGNYDSLSSKGFRGHPVEMVLVWGPGMKSEAMILHGIPEDRIHMIGSIRYNSIGLNGRQPREVFFQKRRLSPSAKTITFAGFIFPFQYFEMLSIFKELRKTDPDLQLIFRTYPNKSLLQSPFMDLLIEYADHTEGIYVSMADPYYREGGKDRVVLQIEEEELWDILHYSDVVINVFSTIAVESCIFDKPVLNMWYFPRTPGVLKPPVYLEYPLHWHTQKLLSYGAVNTATDRQELIRMIWEALQHPALKKEARKNVVEKECGLLDGKAVNRLVACCLNSYETARRKNLNRTSERP